MTKTTTTFYLRWLFMELLLLLLLILTATDALNVHGSPRRTVPLPPPPPPPIPPPAQSRYEFLAVTTAQAVSVVVAGTTSWFLDTRPAVAQPIVGIGSQSSSSSSVPPQQRFVLPTRIRLPLRFLPRGGCLAVPVILNENFRYYAIVDTGSPFLTAPPPAVPALKSLPDNNNNNNNDDKGGKESSFLSSSSSFPDTIEQYGATTGTMMWKVAQTMTMVTNDQSIVGETSIVVGIPESNLVQETGGIYFGLLPQDDNRPALLSQLGRRRLLQEGNNNKSKNNDNNFYYKSFTVSYKKRELILSTQGSSNSPSSSSRNYLNKKNIMPLFDLSRYGPNVYQYAVLAKRIVLEIQQDNNNQNVDDSTTSNNNNNNTQKIVIQPSRPVALVFDTGLTGCIFSDTWTLDLQSHGIQNNSNGGGIMMKDIINVSVELPSGQILQSNHPEYWYLNLVKLPWFPSSSSSSSSSSRKENNNSDNNNIDVSSSIHPSSLFLFPPPHIIALGATFLSNCDLTIDLEHRTVQISP